MNKKKEKVVYTPKFFVEHKVKAGPSETFAYVWDLANENIRRCSTNPPELWGTIRGYMKPLMYVWNRPYSVNECFREYWLDQLVMNMSAYIYCSITEKDKNDKKLDKIATTACLRFKKKLT